MFLKSFVGLAATFFGSVLVYGSGHGEAAIHSSPPPASPAPRYEGRTPIDMREGLKMNNGVFGGTNPQIEAWSEASRWAVGLADKDYPFVDRTRFQRVLGDRLRFYEEAIWNWNQSSEITKLEAKQYAQRALTAIKDRLATAQSAWKKICNASADSWTETQAEAKRTFVDLQRAYRDLHQNASI